jgi:DNA-binding NarL/FixJ family response regulator
MFWEAVADDDTARRGQVMRVVVIDDSQAVQASLCRLLGLVAGIDVVGCAEGVAGAIALIDGEQPDVVVLDVELRDRDRGIDVLHHVVKAHPHIKVIVLSNFHWSAMRGAFIDAGASAYFDKSMQFMQARDYIASLVPPADSTDARVD